jgi:nucleoside-triphosphatase
MKILITGKPNSGKSTLLDKIIKIYKKRSVGIQTIEILNKGEREGFDVINHLNHRSRFMDVNPNDIKSGGLKVGKYYVDTWSLEDILIKTYENGIQENISLLYLDEIGRAQMLSKEFIKQIDLLFELECDLIATIVYDNEPWSMKYKEHPDTFLIEVDQSNRDLLPEIIWCMLNVGKDFDLLTNSQKEYLRERLKLYLDKKMFIQAKKLFYNSVNYVINNQVVKKSAISYAVKGRHHDHTINLINGNYSCDCDLFNGQGKYDGQRGICSHIESVNLFNI